MTRRLTTVALTALLSLTTLGAFAQEHDRGRREHERFDDNDRRVAHEWYVKHQARPYNGFRERDRLEARHEALLVNGYVLDPEFRGRIRTVPSGLYFPRPPRGMRYVVIGGHVVLIDNGYRVHDVLHFEVNF